MHCMHQAVATCAFKQRTTFISQDRARDRSQIRTPTLLLRLGARGRCDWLASYTPGGASAVLSEGTDTDDQPCRARGARDTTFAARHGPTSYHEAQGTWLVRVCGRASDNTTTTTTTPSSSYSVHQSTTNLPVCILSAHSHPVLVHARLGLLPNALKTSTRIPAIPPPQ